MILVKGKMKILPMPKHYTVKSYGRGRRGGEHVFIFNLDIISRLNQFP